MYGLITIKFGANRVYGFWHITQPFFVQETTSMFRLFIIMGLKMDMAAHLWAVGSS